MTGRKWLGALTLLSTLISYPLYGSGPFIQSRAMGLVMMGTQSSIRINGAPAISGTTVFPGDVLETQNGSTALVKLRSGSSLTMTENSEVALESADPAARTERMNLRRGAINLRSFGQQSEWVAVPGASVLVHGEGEFPAICRIAAVGQSTAIINDRGHVEIRGSGAPLILPIGKYATLEAGRPQGGSQAAGTVNAAIPAETVQHNGQTAAPLKIQDTVYWEDVVKTLNTGRVRIALQDGSLLNIGARAEMKIVKHDVQSQQTAIELTAGKVRSQVQHITKPNGSFEVTTPTAVIGVVGTDFIVESHNDNDRKKRRTLIWCLEGSVRVRNLDAAIAGSILLGAGQFTVVYFGMPPATATAVSPGQMQAQVNQTNPSGVTPSPGGIGSTANVLHAGAVGAGAASGAMGGVALSSVGSATTNLGEAGTTLAGATTTLNGIGNTLGGVPGILGNASNSANNAIAAANGATQAAGNASGYLGGVLQMLASPTYPCGCH